MPFEMKVYTPDSDRHYTSNAVQVGDRRPTQTRNPMHRAHIKLAEQARATAPNMKMLIHPMVGMAELDDMDHHTYVDVFPSRHAHGRPARRHLALPHPHDLRHDALILGRKHAGLGANSKGEDF